ncbi:protein FAM162B [Neolamprologus brichardi]|uniref:protein FAM162B n=1 Tax=Neolamprologus brichardi TaxID=32507 RepID=UPI0003EC30DC|nr:protein FAM162B [Neolamprologus brichardi]
MNFIRSRISIGSLLGQRRHVLQTWSHRGMCNKLQETKAESPPAAPAHEPRPAFRLPGYKPSDMDKKMLIWSGRFKSAEQIPETVSFEMIDAARNKIRVKAAYVMMAATIGACMVMVFLGKRSLARKETLTALNIEKKARWREEHQKPSASAVALSDKAQ